MPLDTNIVGKKPPEIPGKYEIIPIHTSDRATFKHCRRQWGWSSPTRLNLVPKASIYGIRMPLWFGTGIHHALQKMYDPVMPEDPVLAFVSWYETQWNGGLVHESELKEFVDRQPKPYQDKPDVYVVAGLREIMPDPDPEEFEAHRLLGIGMLSYYKQYAEVNDNFSVLMVEHQFSVPLSMPDGTVFKMVDTRIMPEGYEHLQGLPKEVHARGRMDIVVQDNDTGQYGIRDYKTASKIDDDYFRHLDLDEQVTTYGWAAQREAELYGLEYTKIDYLDYVALRKAFPSKPTMTSRGLPSVDRQNESTTAVLFEECIKENNLQVVFDGSEKMQAYYDYLVEMGDKLFIQVDKVRRNEAQLRNCGTRLFLEAWDMLHEPALYPNPSKDYRCLNCIFRAPCIAMESDYDYASIIEDGYESNYDR